VLLSTLYALGALIFMTLPETPRRVGVASTSFMRDLVEGVRYIRSRPSILTLVVVAYIVELTVFPYVFFLPAYVEELLRLGSSEESSVQFGLLTTIIAVGALVTSLWVANIADRAQAWTVHAVSAVLFGVLLVLMAVGPPVFEQFAVDIWPSVEDWTLFGIALTPAYVAALGIGILIGAAEIGFLGLNQSLAMKYAHPQFYGRVQAVLLLGFALNGWSGLPIGILAEAIGLLETFAILGVVGAIGAVLALAWGSRRGAREDAVAPAETVELDPVAARERAGLVASG
jgi:predicted MFS family arabinose efflux permease